MVKKVKGNWDIINKNGHSTFHTSKLGKFYQFKQGNLNYDTFTSNLIEEESQCQKKCRGYYSYPLDDRYGASP